MYDDILTSDFCIAVLHDFNPNVFYELAVAHSAGIPVILLSEKGINPPAHGLLESINSVRELKGRREVPFGNNLIPLNATSAELPYVLKTETNASSDYWLQLVSRASKRLHLAGIGSTGWRGIPGMSVPLKTAAEIGCEVRVLTMDAKNPAFDYMMNPEIAGYSNQAPPVSYSHGDRRGGFETDIRSVDAEFDNLHICRVTSRLTQLSTFRMNFAPR